MDPLIISIFILVGIIVSLDVAGLTLTLSREFASGRRSLFLWAASNGLWHAGLLFVYIVVISGVFDISFSFLGWMQSYLLVLSNFLNFLPENFNNYLVALFALLGEHLRLILGLVTVFI